MSSDPDEDDDCGVIPGRMPAHPAAVVDGAGAGTGERGHRDKEWAALTTWLRMNLHQPRTAKREVLFLGQHSEERSLPSCANIPASPDATGSRRPRSTSLRVAWLRTPCRWRIW
ncbi:hypothetical protein Vretifemale_14758 [Volvox reticuliferus]|uniref:Uncharacterized protein n=1 Tax=Volvox reticuliferus TaxID=1737510 RepID=A0A8J4FTM4_9CHLO|nr:hypothetical protein Vretifemale_14758 [Volvox reticuliferus]